MCPEVPIEHWADYLEAFDAMLAARKRRDGEAAYLARREMVAFLEASPDYWRMRLVERGRREQLKHERQESIARLLLGRREAS